MEEKTNAKTEAKCSCLSGLGPFIVGLVVALILGWWVLPGLMLVEAKQPIAFNHVAHIDGAGMECSQCHYVREDGTFHGRPTTADCAECHADAMSDNPEDIRFVNEYVKTGKEIRDEWLIYQKQPDNVFFSHAAHSVERCGTCHTEYEEDPTLLCNQCHLDMAKTTTPPVYKENRLSGYSKDTMIMWTCENCHAQPTHLSSANTSNACFVCHK